MFWNLPAATFAPSRGQEAMDKAISCCCKWNSIFPFMISCQSSNYSLKYALPFIQTVFYVSMSTPPISDYLPCCSQPPEAPLGAHVVWEPMRTQHGGPFSGRPGSKPAEPPKRRQKVLHL